MKNALLICAWAWAGSAGAATLSFPSNAAMTSEQITGSDSYAMPAAPFANGVLPTRAATGQITRQSWQITASGLTTFQILNPLRQQLADQGFSVVFECETEQCGGFDFRFATDVIAAPDMIVDLGDFRYLAATDDNQSVSLLVSRTSTRGYVQMIHAGLSQNAPVAQNTGTAVRAQTTSNTVGLPSDFATALDTQGHVTLSDLAFETGSSNLDAEPFASLERLAQYLADNPQRTIALVGHTDSQGSLDGNVALSKRRAASVLERLVANYGTPRRQLEAQGMGYLAPIATNLTSEGRDTNRRVEVILTSIN
jgi:OOP family OmpA-OmpF porin